MTPAPAAAELTPSLDASPPGLEPGSSGEYLHDVREAPERPRRWFLLFAAVNTYPQLESEETVAKLFERPMEFLAPGFSGVTTFSDMRDRGFLWPPHVGVGRVFGKRWSAFIEVGYSVGKVRTEATDTSLVLWPLHSDYEVKRSALYAGLGLDYFPWGRANLAEYTGFKARLAAARPFIGTRVTWTEAGYRADVKVGPKPFGSLIRVKLDDTWLIPSFNANVGLDVPMTKHSALSLNAGYNFFAYRRYDFEGPAFVVAWKWFFK